MQETLPTDTIQCPGSCPASGAATRASLKADKPTWCPGCGDYAVLAAYQKLLEKLRLPQESIVTLSGIGCSSRFPYFVNTHSVHFIHGRILPFATGLSLARPDLHPFVFIGDGDAYSIGGNHFDHCARKNVRMTVVVMDNQVYGLTKKQTSPTSPEGFRSKTDPWGSRTTPLNPTKKLISSGASFVARTTAAAPDHVLAMLEKAVDHEGFSVVECLSECVQFNRGAYDAANPRKGGDFPLIPDDHDLTDEEAAYSLTKKTFPGYFGVYYQSRRPTLNENESEIARQLEPRPKGLLASEILRASLERLT